MSYIWEENTESDGIMFEYMQLLLCYILINIISFWNSSHNNCQHLSQFSGS